jgi:hypothetical protein
MAQRWHGLLLLLARSTQQGRAGQAGQALAIAGSKAGWQRQATASHYLRWRLEHLFVYNDLITFQKSCPNGVANQKLLVLLS